jgi:hypothetical protein
MGMDVYGKNAQSETGKYFRNNVWFWHPLWDYCLDRHNDVICDHESAGHRNEGFGLDSEQALILGNRLLNEIENGATEEYRLGYYAKLADLPRTDCPHCGATGIRTDSVGDDMGMLTRPLDEATAILVGRTHGWCNGCDGVGTQEPWPCSYPFDIENVKEFAEFCIASGGFEIC